MGVGDAFGRPPFVSRLRCAGDSFAITGQVPAGGVVPRHQFDGVEIRSRALEKPNGFALIPSARRHAVAGTSLTIRAVPSQVCDECASFWPSIRARSRCVRGPAPPPTLPPTAATDWEPRRTVVPRRTPRPPPFGLSTEGYRGAHPPSLLSSLIRRFGAGCRRFAFDQIGTPSIRMLKAGVDAVLRRDAAQECDRRIKVSTLFESRSASVGADRRNGSSGT
jgi:hypothetical protein